MYNKTVIKLLGLMILVFSSFISAQTDDNSTGDIQKMYIEYQLINMKLQSIQQQALSDSEIAEKTEKFGEALDSAMVKKNPSIKEKLIKRDAIINDLEEAQQNGDKDKISKLQNDYKSISDELQPHQQNALEDEGLRNKGEKLNKALVKKMTEIDPEVPNLFSRLEVLSEKLQAGIHQNHLD